MSFFSKIFNRNKIEVDEDELVWRREETAIGNPQKNNQSSQIPKSFYQSDFSSKTTQQVPQKSAREFTTPKSEENNYQLNSKYQTHENQIHSNTENFPSKSSANFYRRRVLQLKNHQTNPTHDYFSGMTDSQVYKQNSPETTLKMKRM